MRVLAAAVLLSLMSTGGAIAGTPYPVKMKCPVGGESFTHIETMSSSQWGGRPDGKPYGSWEFPMPLAQCPGNGLVIYKEFTKEEIARLKPLIESPDYQALRGDTSYYRAAWLIRAMGQSKPMDNAWLILQASWQADEKPELKSRYQREMVEAMMAVPPAPHDMGWVAMQGRTANSLRELGEYDRAAAVLKSVSFSTTSQTTGPVEPNEDDRRGWLAYFKAIETLVARRDPSSEPLDMIPPREAAAKCMGMGAAAAKEPHCGTGAVKKQIDNFRKLGAAMEQEGH